MMGFILILVVVGSLCFIFYTKLWVNYCESSNQLMNKTVLITGGNHGLGKTLAEELAKRSNVRVIIASRNLKKSVKTIMEIKNRWPGRPINMNSMFLDLSDFDSIHKFVDQLIDREPELDYLIANAGVVTRGKTKQGYDITMGVNHLGHFLLINLLLEKMNLSITKNISGKKLHIVNISSRSLFISKLNIANMEIPSLNISNIALFSKYADSKMALTCCMAYLSHKIKESGCKSVFISNAFPGGFPSDLGKTPLSLAEIFRRTLIKVFFKSLYKAAQTPLYCILDDRVVNGGYYFNCRPHKGPESFKDNEYLQTVWNKSARLTGHSVI